MILPILTDGTAVVLPIGDGVVISIKQEKDKVKNDEK